MTTYNGRSAQFVPGRETPNKEPPMNRFVIEKLYRVHRERMIKIEPLVDCHVYIPEFMKGSNTWKKNAAEARQNRILAENAHMYGRIDKVEKSESLYIKEQRQHIRRMETKGHYLRRLKETDRVHRIMKIQKENEYMLKRIEKAQPSLGRKKMQQWYKYHQLFKDGRRTDPTAGHIMHGMNDIMPTKLPPLDSVMGSFDRASHSLAPGSIYNNSGEIDRSAAPSRSRSSLRTSSLTTRGTPLEHPSKSASELDDLTRDTRSSSLQPLVRPSFQQPSSMQMLSNNSYYSAGTSLLAGEDSQLADQSHISFISSASQQSLISSPQHHRYPRASPNSSPAKMSMFGWRDGGGHDISDNLSEEQSHHSSAGGTSGMDKYNISHVLSASSSHDDLSSKHEPFHHLLVAGDEQAAGDTEHAGGDLDSVASRESTNLNPSEYQLLISKAAALPFDSKNCLLQVHFRTAYDEHLYVRVLSTGVSPHLLGERAVPIDAVFETVSLASHHSQIKHSLENENLSSLSSLLIDMFQEADVDDAGSLTFDQFQALMEQVELGISPQELRFVISEADENENGVVDYHEFVPLAVDLIQSFRARNRAKVMYSQKDVEVDETIMKAISSKDLERINDLCLEKIYEVDAKKYGLIRIPELKRCLLAVAVTAGLRDNEISMICQLLPRDQFDRCKYNSPPDSFFDVLSKVRFMTMKNAMIESQGSGLQKYLLDLCRDEEGRLNEAHEKGAAITGMIPFRALINILSNSARLSLSRLQVLVLMSEAHVQEGMINYFQFIPVVAKAIEIMFEPKALRQRAELIERTDLSPEGLIQGMSSDVFEQRLLTLFKSYDIERSGALDQNEFIACLESLELQLTYAESVALFHSADREHTGMVEFEGFISFFTNNLIDLEREKQIRLQLSHAAANDDNDDDLDGVMSTGRDSLASSLGGHSFISRSSSMSMDEFSSDFVSSVTHFCRELDPDERGRVPYEHFEEAFSEVYTRDLSLSYTSEFLVDFIVSEVRSGADRSVVYVEEIAACALLLKRLRLKEVASSNYLQLEESVAQQADLLVATQEEELAHIRNYLMHLTHHHDGGSSHHTSSGDLDDTGKYNHLVRLFQDARNGLARTEANYLVNRFLMTRRRDSDDDNGGGMRTIMVDSDELLVAMRYARKLTVMRRVLEGISFSSISSIVGRLLNAEKAQLQAAEQAEKDSHFIPFPYGMKVLENSRRLLVNLAARMQIIAWSDCFDKEVHHLAMEKFREHAANSICKYNMPEMMRTRADIIALNGFDEKSILAGMTEPELLAQLEESFASISAAETTIKYSAFCDALVSLSDIHLSEAEVATLASLFTAAEEPLHRAGSLPDDLLSFSPSRDLRRLVFSITTLCRERLIHRRVALHVVSTHMPSDIAAAAQPLNSPDNKGGAFALRALKKEHRQLLQTTAEKLLTFTKLTVQGGGDALTIVLPIDSGDRTRRRRSSVEAPSSLDESSSLLDDNVLAVSDAPIQWSRLRARLPSKPNTPNIVKVVNRVTVASKAASGPHLTRSSVSKLSTPEAPALVEYEKVETLWKRVAMSISIHEDLQTLSETQLVCRCLVKDVDAEREGDEAMEIVTTLNVKLPSLALVDHDAAVEFATNLMGKLYVEEIIGKSIELKIKD